MSWDFIGTIAVNFMIEIYHAGGARVRWVVWIWCAFVFLYVYMQLQKK